MHVAPFFRNIRAIAPVFIGRDVRYEDGMVGHQQRISLVIARTYEDEVCQQMSEDGRGRQLHLFLLVLDVALPGTQA